MGNSAIIAVKYATKASLFFLFAIVINLGRVEAQSRRTAKNKVYILEHAAEAVAQMDRHGVPASITMAQALVETAAGTSTLAKVHNNHFGIKCHSSWQGRKTYHDDDERGECFRSYTHWQESYEDHSLFLKKNRYKKLFILPYDDYRGWARGLQQAGYATNRGYANMLIATIEDCELYALDYGKMPSWIKSSSIERAPTQKAKARGPVRDAFLSYGLLYVLAKEGDSYQQIAIDMDLKAEDVASYNDAPLDFPLRKGDVVYLERKNKRSTIAYPIYTVKIGDSMHSISQTYGIRLENLYKLNNLEEDYYPEEGDVLRLR